MDVPSTTTDDVVTFNVEHVRCTRNIITIPLLEEKDDDDHQGLSPEAQNNAAAQYSAQDECSLRPSLPSDHTRGMYQRSIML